MSPTPWRSYFLDIAPETSLARKLEQWQLEDLHEHARLFHLEYAAHGARRLDGERTPTELNAEIAREIWISLR